MRVCVAKVTRDECRPFLLGVHYAKRMCSTSYAYGLINMEGDIIGVVTYGTPPSAPLRTGLAGKENMNKILELNRLCLKDNKPNYASFLVSKSLKMLPEGKIVISFADTEQGHIGYVYQACNFLYYGLSAKRTDWKIKGKEHLHGQTVADEFRGAKNRAEKMREKYGDAFYLSPRPRKHRYVYVTGGKKYKKLYNCIKYQQQLYPKE